MSVGSLYLGCSQTLERISRLRDTASENSRLADRTLAYLLILRALETEKLEKPVKKQPVSDSQSNSTNTVALQNLKIKLADATVKLKSSEVEIQTLKARLSSIDQSKAKTSSKTPKSIPLALPKPSGLSATPNLKNPRLSPLRKMVMLSSQTSKGVVTSTPSEKKTIEQPAKAKKPSLFDDSDDEPEENADEAFKEMFKPMGDSLKPKSRPPPPKIRKLNNAFKKTAVYANDDEGDTFADNVDPALKSPFAQRLKTQNSVSAFASPLRRKKAPSIFGN